MKDVLQKKSTDIHVNLHWKNTFMVWLKQKEKVGHQSVLLSRSGRVVTKISSCRVNTTSRRGIKRLGISFGSIFLLFSNKSSRGPLY